MKVFVTGASGFIGRAFCNESLAFGFQLLCLTRDSHTLLPDNCHVAEGSLEELPWKAIEAFQPDAVLHLAWETTPGEYLHSPSNGPLLSLSQSMFAGLVERGVQHIAATGTCIEYAPSGEPLHEFESPAGPAYPYSIAKYQLFEWLRDRVSESETTWSWLRVFYPYGPGEHPNRLTTSVARKLLANEPVILRTPESTRDFIYIADLAKALCTVLESRLTGPVNLGTGKGTTILEIVDMIAELLHLSPSVTESSEGPVVDPTPVVIADIQRILTTGWRPETSIERGLAHLVETLR